jgi:starch synthase
MGAAGRRRAEERFAWDAIATRTLEVYGRVLTHV